LKKNGNKIDLESYWCPWKGIKTTTLNKGVDFDEVILALSIGALPSTCKELIAVKQNWVDMIENIPAIQTQAFQIWLNKPTKELGIDVKLAPGDNLLNCNWIPPVVCFGDYSELLKYEAWENYDEHGTNPVPKSIFYFCGPKDEPNPHLSNMERYQYPPFDNTTYTEIEFNKTVSVCAQSLRSAMGNTFMRKAGTELTPYGFDFDLLHTTFKNINNISYNKFNQQYVRANIDPTERYVLSIPGGIKHRLHPWESGFDNLTLCGDWTYTGYNYGCAEGACISGQLASYTLIGYPQPANIFGYYFLHPDQEKTTPIIGSKF